jgi:hypothetical protein
VNPAGALAGAREPLRVGVTGHRIFAEGERIAAGVERALDGIQRAFPSRPLVAVSALAEGADRLVAERVLARGGGALEVVLPLPRDEYLTDFPTTASRQAFAVLLQRAARVRELPAAGGRDEAYAAGGEAVLERADVMLVVWDGQGAQGRGGTGAIVARARARGLPIAWVHAGNRRPGTMEPVSLGADQGSVSFENLPEGRRG